MFPSFDLCAKRCNFKLVCCPHHQDGCHQQLPRPRRHYRRSRAMKHRRFHHQDHTAFLVKTIGDSSSGGFIDNAKNLKPCNCTGILSCPTLSVIEKLCQSANTAVLYSLFELSCAVATGHKHIIAKKAKIRRERKKPYNLA